METKEGEIFEHNGEWYQCIVENGCENCAFNERKCYTIVDECGADRRKDKSSRNLKRSESLIHIIVQVVELYIFRDIRFLINHTLIILNT